MRPRKALLSKGEQLMIEIDGSYLEAGGQIIRTAVGLSALTGKACRIFNIRAGRPKPGLMAQHLTGVKAVAKLCDAKLIGAELWSTELTFEPNKIQAGQFTFDIGTAGAISLVLQSLTIPAVAAPGKIILDIQGGTDVAWSPSMIYFQNIFCYWLGKMGVKAKTEIMKYGFYPKGGGQVHVEIQPSEVTPIRFVEREDLSRIDAWSIASETLKTKNVAGRQIDGVKKILKLTPDSKIHIDYADSLSPGSSVYVHAHYLNCKLGASAIGERNKKAEAVGEEAARELESQMRTPACMDKHMADQILPYMALATEKGRSEVSVAEVTNHCLTNIWVIEKFLPVKFEIAGKKGEPGTIRCTKK